ncbi:MAG: extracellular solute-binding protein [Verrucomicrobia bacterium]|nr:extracellular solute-binding protein [Verrucomicrobiota bacterium]
MEFFLKGKPWAKFRLLGGPDNGASGTSHPASDCAEPANARRVTGRWRSGWGQAGRRLLAVWLLAASVPALPCPAQADGRRPDLSGKTINLSLLGVAGFLPSKLPMEMAPAFAKYARDRYGYTATFAYADAPLAILFQKAGAVFASRSNEHSLLLSDTQWLGALAEAHWIVKLDDLVRQNPELAPRWYDPGLERAYTEYPDNSGHKVALPEEVDVLVLYVRKDLFGAPEERDAYHHQTGRDLPQTFEDWEKIDFDEFRRLTRFFTRPQADLYGTVFTHSKRYDCESMALYPIQWSMGGTFWNEKTHDVEGYLNTEVNARGLEYQKTFLAFEPPGALNYGVAENAAAFTKGQAATSMTWAGAGPAMITDANRDRVMVVPAPGFRQPDGSIKRRYCFGGLSWVINQFATQEQKWVIRDFLEWWYRPETQLEFAKRGGNPALKAALEDPRFDGLNPWNRALKFMIPFNRDFYHSPKYAELLAIQQEAFSAYLSGTCNDATKALSWAAARQQRALYDVGETTKTPTPAYLQLRLK